MPHVCEKIEDALALSKRWQVPVLVFVHSALTGTAGNHNSTVDDDFAEMYTKFTPGKKILNMNFRLSGEPFARDGRAQRRALEIILHETRLESMTILHFMEAGSAACDLFVAAVPEVSHVVPRLHLFPSSLRQQPRSVMHASSLTPRHISDALLAALQMPPLTKTVEAKDEFMRQVEEMNTEVAVSTSTASASVSSSADKSFSAGAGGGGGALSGLHFIALNGLDKREAILTSPGMTLRTVWVKVQKSLEQKQQEERASARHRRPVEFVLQINPPATATTHAVEKSGDDDNISSKNDNVVVVDCIEAAAKMDIHTLPHNTVVTVVRDCDNSAAPPLGESKSCSEVQAERCDIDKQVGDGEQKAVVRCEGGVCKIGRPPSSNAVPPEEQKKISSRASSPRDTTTTAGGEKQNQQDDDKKPTTQAGSPAASAPGPINIRCSLPTGGTHTVDSLDPATATLSADLRGPIAEIIGSNAFVFARAYPPHRFTPDEEAQPLEALGMRTSSALRVVSTAAQSSKPPPAAAAAAANNSNNNSAGLFGLVSSLLRRASGGNLPSGSTAPMSSAGPRSGAGPAASSRFRTMGEIRAEEEEEENRLAAAANAMAAMADQQNQQRRKKANRYYGGGSTEYTGWDNNEEDKKENDEGKSESGKASHQTKKNQ